MWHCVDSWRARSDYEKTAWLLWSYLNVFCVFFLYYSSIVGAEHWYHQHSWIWQHHPALEWRQEDVQRNRGLHESQVRDSHDLVLHFNLKLLQVSHVLIYGNSTKCIRMNVTECYCLMTSIVARFPVVHVKMIYSYMFPCSVNQSYSKKYWSSKSTWNQNEPK